MLVFAWNVFFAVVLWVVICALVVVRLALKATKEDSFKKIQEILFIKAAVLLVYGGVIFVINYYVWAVLANFLIISFILLLSHSFLSNKIKSSSNSIKKLQIIITPLFLLSKPMVFAVNKLIKEKSEALYENDIKYITQKALEQKNINQIEADIINNAFEFKTKHAEDIAVHRTHIEAIDIEANFDEIFQTILRFEYSRYPIYEDSIDNIVGILHVKDFLQYVATDSSHENKGEFSVKNIMRPPHFVIMSSPINEIFATMQKAKRLMVIVVDEYGGCYGLITSEDLVEQIVGEIYDEHDDLENNIMELSKGLYKINGGTLLEEIEKTMGLEFDYNELPFDKYYTIGGFLVHLFDKIPTPGDKIEYNKHTFYIETIEDRRITSIRISFF